MIDKIMLYKLKFQSNTKIHDRKPFRHNRAGTAIHTLKKDSGEV
jgi:hypothetical protein